MKKTASKGYQTLGVLRRNLKNCPQKLKSLAYTSILRPKLEYASPVWDPYTDDNIKKLEMDNDELHVLPATTIATTLVLPIC